MVEGQAPQLFQSYRVFGDGKAIGNTLMENPPPNLLVNTELLPESSASLTGIPDDAVPQDVFLWWSASLAPGQGMGAVDNDALFVAADGTTINVIADQCRFMNANFDGGQLGFYYCRADVTAFVTAHPGMFSWNGTYTVGDVFGDPGEIDVNDPLSCAPFDPLCQAKYAAWSMVFVYDSPSETLQRDVILYDGFAHFDETNQSLGRINFNISGFEVGTPPAAELTYFGLEGDQQLGAGPGGHCNSCPDFFAVNGVNLSDGFNPAGNSYNSSDALGVDIDEFNIGATGGGLGILNTGATSATITTGSGDTVLNGSGQTGESIFLGYVFLRLNRPSPNFRGSQTTKLVDPPQAATGETLFYSATVTNQGSLPATNVIFTDTLPAGTTYQAGSVRVGGVACTDAADMDACTVSGNTITVNLGTIPPSGANQRLITFRGTLTAAGVGQQVCNVGQVTAAETPTPAELGPACTTVKTATLGQPQKIDVDLTGGVTGPDDVVQYTITIPGDPGSPVSGVVLEDDVPAGVQLLGYTGPGGSAVDETTFVGGANGNGRVRFSNVSIPAGGVATITMTVQIDSEAEFAADGVPAAMIHGRQVCNQGTVNAGFLPAPRPTDDPATGASQDATCLTLTYAPIFASSSKTVVDDDGGLLEPNDTLTYTISLVNSGNRVGTITLADDMPQGVQGFTLLTPIAGAVFSPPPAGANGNGRLDVTGLVVPPGTTVTIQFRVTVKPDAADGTVVQNAAAITVAERPQENRTLTSAALTVFARPDLTGFTKAVADLNGGAVEPGDTLQYTLAVTNTGNRPATSTVITDVVDVRLGAVTPQDGGTFNAATRTITWNVGTIAVGATVTVRFTAQIVSPQPNGTTIANQASIDSAEAPPASLSDDPATAAVDDPTVVTITSAPNLGNATKTVSDLGGGVFSPGDVVEYTVSFTNTGTAAATNVVVSDPVDPSLTAVQPLDGGTFAGGSVTWTVGTVNPGQTVTRRFRATIVSPLLDGTVVANQASIAASELAQPVLSDDPATAAVDDPTTFTVTSRADFTTSTISFEDLNGGAHQPGDQIRYTVTAVNTGDSPATTVVITVPADVNYAGIVVEDGGVFDPVSRTITWTVPGTLQPGVPVEVHFVGTLAAGIPDGTNVCEAATIDSAQSPPFTTASVCFVVTSEPDLAASEKTVVDLNGGQVVPGDVLEWTITVDNVGSAPALSVVVTDVVDVNLTAITPLDGGVFNPVTRTITWSIAMVPAQSAQTVRFQAAVVAPLDDGTVISNQGSLTCGGCATPVLTDDPATAAPDDPTVVVVNATTTFTVSKTAGDDDGGVVEPGDALTWSIVVTNTGTACADDVVVVDPIDGDVGAPTAEQGGVFDAGAGTVTWTGATTPALVRVCPGAANAVTLVVHAAADAPLDDGTQICDQAQVTSEEVPAAVLSDDPATATAGDATCLTVVSGAAFGGATKTVADQNGAPARPGDTLTYTITFSNEGNANAVNVEVRDPLDPSLTAVTPGQGGVVAGNEIRWDAMTTPALALVAPGQTITLTFTATIVTPLDDDTVISNQASVDAAQGVSTPVVTDDPSTALVDDPTLITVRSSVTVRADKIVTDENGGQPLAGDVFLYTVTIVAEGDAPARDVVVTDVLDANLDFVQVLDGGSFDAASRTVSWNLAQVLPGTPAPLRFRARAAPGTTPGTVIVNQASFTHQGDPNPVLSDDPGQPGSADPTVVVIEAVPEPDVHAEKTVADANGGAVQAGDELVYTLVVRNDGTLAAPGARVLDALPASTQYVPGSTTVGGAGVPDAGALSPLMTPPGLALGDLDPGESVTITFRVRVAPGTAPGTIVSNQAAVSDAGGGSVLSDDPTTATPGDPTQVIVGGGAILTAVTKSFEPTPVGDDGDGVFEAGEIVEYRVLVENTGDATARDVVFTDTIAAQGDYVAGSLRLGGATLTDAADGDAGEVVGDAITVRAGDIAAGAAREIRFQVRIAAASGTLVNQGEVDSDDTPPERTDADGNDANGDQPTVVPIGATGALVVGKSVVDLSGGDVLAGDELGYTVTVTNPGGAAASDVTVRDALPAELEYVTGSTVWPGAGDPFVAGQGLVMPGLALGPGETITITFRARLAADLADDTRVCNVARAEIGGPPPFESNEACVTVGLPAGAAGLRGRAYIDAAPKDRAYQADDDEALAELQIVAYTDDAPGAKPVAGVTTDGEGLYRFDALPPGSYTLRAFSSRGTQLAKLSNIEIAADEAREQDVWVDPSGRLYNAVTGDLVGDAVVILRYDADDPMEPGGLVPPERLGPGQQGQRTAADGIYRFDVLPGRKYRLEVEAAGTSWSFPSQLTPPTEGFAPAGPVVPEIRPSLDPAQARTYYLRFDIAAAGDDVTNNHVPLDPLASLVRLDKRADRYDATLGEIVTYTVTVQNTSTRDLTAAAGAPAFVLDAPARGLTYLPGQAVAEVRKGSEVRRFAAKLGGFQDQRLGDGQVRFGPFDLPAGGTLTVVYQVVVGVDTRAGIYENRAILVGAAGEELSNEDRVKLRVKNDPIFDEGLVIGRVFCDADGDGRADKGEAGVMGARVYVDTGSYAVSDSAGKYHLSSLDPGMHLFKLDPDTLPPGSTVSDDVGSQLVYFTRGFTTRIDFPVTCGEKTSVTMADESAASIKLSGKTKAKLPPKKVWPKVSTTIAGDLGTMALVVDGKSVAVPRAEIDLVVDAKLELPKSEGAPNLVAPGEKGWPAGGPQPVFRGRVTGAEPESWSVSLKRVLPTGELEPVRTLRGQGAPGDVAWDGLDDGGTPVARDAVYVAQLRVSAAGEVQLSSPRLSFGVAYGVPEAPERTETLRGAFFAGGAKKPRATKLLKKHVGGLAGRIGPEDTVIIEVHADGTGNRLARIAETQKQADLVRDLLIKEGVAADRIKARGRGSLDPIGDVKTRVGRVANKRVVVRIVPPPPRQSGAPVPAPAPGAVDVMILGESAAVDEGGRFVKNVPTPADGRILVDLQAADGRHLSMWLTVPPPEGKAAPPKAPPAGGKRHQVRGDVATGAVSIDGAALDTTLVTLDVGIEGAAPGSEPDYEILPPKKARKVKKKIIPALPARLDRPVRFELGVPGRLEAGAWTLTVTDAGGAVVWRSDGRGLPPPTLDWDGTGTDGTLLVKAGGRYHYRLEVEDVRGSRGLTPMRAFTVGAGKQKGAFATIVVKGNVFTRKNDPGAGLKNKLARFASALPRRPAGETYTIEIVVAVTGNQTETEARLAAAARAKKLEAYLVKLKVPLERVQITTSVLGPDVPKKQRTSSVTITAIPPRVEAPARAVVNGADADVLSGAFAAEVTTTPGGALVIDITRPGGQRAVWILTEDALPGAAPAAPPATQPATQPGSQNDTDLSTPGFTGAPRTAGAGPDDVHEPRLDRGPTVTLSLAEDPDEFGGEELENSLAEPETVTPRGDDGLLAPDGTTTAAAAPKKRAAPLEITETGTNTKIRVPAEVLAADLVVDLPPRGLKLAAPDLWVTGRTNPKNRVRVNGHEVTVRADGRFDELVTLPPGESTLVVEAIDPDENIAMISWPVTVSETQQFLLVLADGTVSTAYQTGSASGWTTTGAELDGMNDDTTARAGHVLFHGRVALYYKARVKGNKLFGRINVTAHVDTARQGEQEEFFQSTLDPNRDYAVYGDSATEVRDANARGKLYVLVEADDSKAIVGNFRTDLRSGGELFRYDRTVYGGAVDFKKTFQLSGGTLKQEARVFATGGDGRVARDVNVFRATGGSLYYLRHGRVVEGGERVRLVIRDRDNGLVLSERALARDADYVIDYAGGRIMFKTPIASTVDGAFLLDNLDGSAGPLDGNPVYVEVSYEYEPDAGDGHAAGGAYVRDTIFDTVSIGAGIVGEGRGGDDLGGDYSLMGIDAQWKPRKRTTVRAELARSTASDADNWLSQDGGLTFQGLNGIATTTTDGGEGGHLAWKVEVDTTVGDWARAEWAEGLRVKAYAQELDRGFFSGGSILEQGRQKYGVLASYALTAVDTLVFRHDSDIAELPRIGPTPDDILGGDAALELDERTSRLTSLTWTRTGGKLGYKAELAHQGIRSASVETDRFGLGGQVTYKQSRRLTLRAGQEFTFTASDRDPVLSPIDPLAPTQRSTAPLAGITTSVGADWEIAPDLILSGTVGLRWNGDTAAQIGFKTPVGDDASMYTSERIEVRDGRTVNTTIVGAEQRFGDGPGAGKPGKAYGEYQLENGIAGDRNRAVLGIGHRWRVARGVNIVGGYEHQQVFGVVLPDGTPAGDQMRDVLHLALEWVRPEKWKASASVEVRYDQGGASAEPRYQSIVGADPRPQAPAGTFADHGGTAPGAPLVVPGGERLQIVTSVAGDWKWSEDLTFLGRFRLAHTEDLTNAERDDLPAGVPTTFTQARFIEATAGWAYRPLRFDWLDVLFRYSFLFDQRPLDAAGAMREDQSHVLALAPVATLPLRLKLSGKLAWKHTRSESELLEDQNLAAATDAILFLTRLGYRFYGKWDATVEYRVLWLDHAAGAEQKQGFLVEVDYDVTRYVRLGLGYNFSHFSDDELGQLDRDSHGFFLRVVGRF